MARLTIDVLRDSDPAHHGMSAAQRVSYYIRQMQRGNIRLLCADCHAKQAAALAKQSLCRVSQAPSALRIIRLLTDLSE